MLKKRSKLVLISYAPRAEKVVAIPERKFMILSLWLNFSVPFSILIPEVVNLCKGKKSELNGQPIYVVAAGAVYNGGSLAASLM
jgi:hypothetical protein